MICFLDNDTDIFDNVAEVLEGDTLILYQFKIYLDYVVCTSINLLRTISQ